MSLFKRKPLRWHLFRKWCGCDACADEDEEKEEAPFGDGVPAPPFDYVNYRCMMVPIVEGAQQGIYDTETKESIVLHGGRWVSFPPKEEEW